MIAYALGEHRYGQHDYDVFLKRIKAEGKAALPVLRNLLKHPDTKVRETAANVIDDAEGFSENELDYLIPAARAGNTFAFYAIAKIGTPRALDFLGCALGRGPRLGLHRLRRRRAAAHRSLGQPR